MNIENFTVAWTGDGRLFTLKFTAGAKTYRLELDRDSTKTEVIDKLLVLVAQLGHSDLSRYYTALRMILDVDGDGDPLDECKDIADKALRPLRDSLTQKELRLDAVKFHDLFDSIRFDPDLQKWVNAWFRSELLPADRLGHYVGWHAQ